MSRRKETKADELRKWLKDKRFQITVSIICLAVMIICLLTGCTKTAMKRTVTRELVQCCHLPNPIITEYTAFTHYEFLMRSKMEGAEMVVDGDYRHLSIESREQRPDPNTIKEITEVVVTGLVGVGL